MSAHILAFSRLFNHDFVQRRARLLADALSAEEASAPLRRQQIIQHDSMRRRCVTHRMIARRLAVIERRIHATAWQMMLATRGLA